MSRKPGAIQSAWASRKRGKGHDYVVVPLTTGKIRLVEPNGIRDVELMVGTSYAKLTGVAHNVININDFEFSFVEIERK